MKLLKNKKGEANVNTIEKVVEKVVDRPLSWESKFFRAIGAVAITLVLISWFGAQLGINETTLAEGLTAHNFAMWSSILIMLIAASVGVRKIFNILTGKQQQKIGMGLLQAELITIIVATILFLAINAGVFADIFGTGIGFTVIAP